MLCMISRGRYLGICLLFAAMAVHAAEPEAAYIGQPRPEVILPDQSGKTRSLDEWRGKILVINFWATWCGPCLREIPMLNAMQKKFGTERVQFIGIAVDNLEAVSEFTHTTPIAYPVLIGGLSGAAIAEDFGDERGVLPYSVVVNRKGVIAAIALGELKEEVLRAYIEKLP